MATDRRAAVVKMKLIFAQIGRCHRCAFVGVLAVFWAACNSRPGQAPGISNPRQPSPIGPELTPTAQKSPPETDELPAADPRIENWLVVERIKSGVAGGWATGSFDGKRNTLAIETHDVTRFALEVSKIPIQWERVVVLEIDGTRSELRKRDAATLHVVLDEYGKWSITESP